MTLSPILRVAVLGALASLLPLAGCTTITDVFAGDKVDYRSNTTRAAGLDVPPDLTQLAKESRYQQPNGTVSASTFQTAASGAAAGTASGTAAGTASSTASGTTSGTVVAVSAPGTAPVIALPAAGNFHLERLGNERWLSTTLSPDEVFPQVRAFWKDNGFSITEDRAQAGVLETDWAENRAKLPNDIVRNTIGKVFEGIYSTGELDKYRTRVERTATGSDIYVTHRGMVEVYTGQRQESTVWQPRPSDPGLEAEFLARLMVKLGAKDEQARAIVATSTAAPAAPARARVVADRPGPTLQVDDNFDRAWRRVGVALDRSGFTVEDRDRTQGLYFVRYVDPKFAGRDEPNFFTRFFFRRKDDEGTPVKYHIKVTGEGNSSSVAVLDSTGKPENSDNGKRIASLLLDDLK